MSLPERENELLTTLQTITDAEIPYVLVGGWAVTAFNQRFSTDVDLVIPETALREYETVLADHGYERTGEYDTSALYDGRFIQYAKDVVNPVSVELLVNALRCRQASLAANRASLGDVARRKQNGRIDISRSIRNRRRSDGPNRSTHASPNKNCCWLSSSIAGGLPMSGT